MRLVQSYFSSLDGVVQAPGGPEEDTDGGFSHGGWSMPYFDPEVMGGFIGESMGTADALLFGRRTWEVMAAAWPERDDGSDPFATHMNTITKYVVSTTLADDDMGWNNSHLLSADDSTAGVAAVKKLKQSGDGELSMMGSSELGRSLLAAGLVDELRLLIEPVILGGGKSAFPDDGGIRHFELVESTVASTGVICCTYRPTEAPAMPTEFPKMPEK